MKHLMHKHLPLLLLPAFLFLACNQNKENAVEPSDSKGALLIRLTDAPFPFDLIEEANVTIMKVEIRQQTADTGKAFLTLSEETMSFNLLELQNDVTAVLVQANIPVGRYDLIRLFVSEASILLKDGTLFDLKVPSGAETGIKLFVKPAIEVVEDAMAEILLDFDVSKSFIVKGNPNTPAGIQGFNFIPVIRAANLSLAGKISGLVMNSRSQLAAGATVWVERDSVISTAFANTVGTYAFLGIPSGRYRVKAVSIAHDTVSVEVDVAAGGHVIADLQLATQGEK